MLKSVPNTQVTNEDENSIYYKHRKQDESQKIDILGAKGESEIFKEVQDQVYVGNNEPTYQGNSSVQPMFPPQMENEIKIFQKQTNVERAVTRCNQLPNSAVTRCNQLPN